MKKYKFWMFIALMALLALCLPVTLLFPEIGYNLLHLAERSVSNGTIWKMLSHIPKGWAPVLVAASGWALTYVFGQIRLLFTKSDTQNIFVYFFRGLRDKCAYLTNESAAMLLKEEKQKAIIFGTFSAIVAIMVWCVSNLFICISVSILAIILFALFWLTPFMWKGKGAGTMHYVLPALVDFAVSYAIAWKYGIPSLVFYQVFRVYLMWWAKNLINRQNKKYPVELSETLKDIELFLRIDESGSMDGYEESAKSCLEAIVKPLVQNRLNINLSLNTFGGNNRVLKHRCSPEDMLDYIKYKFLIKYSPHGGTPLNEDIISIKDQLSTARSDAIPAVIFITDGEANHGYSERAHKACMFIEEELNGVVAMAGVGSVSESYLKNMVTSEDRYKIFSTGNFASAGRAIANGILNITIHGRTAKFFGVMG